MWSLSEIPCGSFFYSGMLNGLAYDFICSDFALEWCHWLALHLAYPDVNKERVKPLVREVQPWNSVFWIMAHKDIWIEN